MIARRSPPLVLALLCGVLIAACGGGGSSSTSATTTAGASAQSSTAAPGAQGPPTAPTATTSTQSSPLVAAAVQQQVTICKSVITRASVAASLKAKLDKICRRAANGDLVGAREAAKEVCADVVNAQPLTPAQKQEALPACRIT